MSIKSFKKYFGAISSTIFSLSRFGEKYASSLSQSPLSLEEKSLCHHQSSRNSTISRAAFQARRIRYSVILTVLKPSRIFTDRLELPCQFTTRKFSLLPLVSAAILYHPNHPNLQFIIDIESIKSTHMISDELHGVSKHCPSDLTCHIYITSVIFYLCWAGRLLH